MVGPENQSVDRSSINVTLNLSHREVSPELGPYHSVRAVSAAHLTPHHAVLGSVLERLRLKPSHHIADRTEPSS